MIGWYLRRSEVVGKGYGVSWCHLAAMGWFSVLLYYDSMKLITFCQSYAVLWIFHSELITFSISHDKCICRGSDILAGCFGMRDAECVDVIDPPDVVCFWCWSSFISYYFIWDTGRFGLSCYKSMRFKF